MPCCMQGVGYLSTWPSEVHVRGGQAARGPCSVNESDTESRQWRSPAGGGLSGKTCTLKRTEARQRDRVGSWRVPPTCYRQREGILFSSKCADVLYPRCHASCGSQDSGL